jgi:DNA-binding NarL/FixJ family response regulator
MTIRIMVADDHPIYREGVATSLEETGEFRVVGTASSAEEAIRLVVKQVAGRMPLTSI